MDVEVSENIQRKLSATLLQIRAKSPFFATLSLYAQLISRDDIDTAATDGQNIFYNPGYISSLTQTQLAGLLMHEILHAALLHVTRRGLRNPTLWNIAADIVVNGVIREQGDFDLPHGAIEDKSCAKLSTEEVYELLIKKEVSVNIDLLVVDLIPADSQSPNIKSKAEIETYWRSARTQAIVVDRRYGEKKNKSIGSEALGWQRELWALEEFKLDWRSLLWRYLSHTPVDYSGFDRRFVGQGLYLDALEGETFKGHIAVDTSGSVSDKELKDLISEIDGILSSYPHVKCDLYFADSGLYGPYSLERGDTMPKPKGGGGTSFIPFFKQIAEGRYDINSEVCIYFTDGYGVFPKQAPEIPVLWVVPSGGLPSQDFPFGEVVRMVC
jgi:predicted metal-dependent peptidase